MNDHLNLFYSYGSPDLENNVTRALILTLKNLEPVQVRTFLAETVLPADGRGSRRIDPLAEPHPRFDLQVAPFGEEDLLTRANGLLVGITYSGDQETDLQGATGREGGSRPDALIADEGNELRIVIESKMGDDQRSGQLGRHFDGFFDESRADIEDVYREVSWTDVARGLRRVQGATRNPRARYVIDEFVEYLDELGLLTFLGFSERDFAEERDDKLDSFVGHLVRALEEELGIEKGDGDRRILVDGTSLGNLYLMSDPEGIRSGIILGSSRKHRARFVKKLAAERPDEMRAVLDELRAELPEESPLELKVPSVFHYSQFRRTHIWSIGGLFAYPERFEAFRSLITDDERNTFEWLGRSEISDRFEDQLPDKAEETGPEDRFPKWDDVDEYLQYLYLEVYTTVPKERLVGIDTKAAIDEVARVVEPQVRALRRFEAL